MRSGSPTSLGAALALALSAALVLGAAPGCGRSQPDLLLVAPFAEGVGIAEDDPDTLRAQLRGHVGRLSLVPRNDVDAATVAAAVAEEAPDVLWLRLADDPRRWMDALPQDWAGLVIHSVAPAHRRFSGGGPRRPAVDLADDPAPRAVLLAPRVDREQVVGRYAQHLLAAWSAGASVAEANRRAADALGVEPWRLGGNPLLTLQEVRHARRAEPSED